MWENISNDSTASSQRLKTPFGWVVRTIIHGHPTHNLHQVYVPDPDHVWELEQKEEE